MNKNDLIIYEFNQLDISDLSEEYSFLHYTKELINCVYEYGNFKKEDIETQLRQLEESKNKNILSYFNNVHVAKELPSTAVIKDDTDNAIKDLDNKKKIKHK